MKRSAVTFGIGAYLVLLMGAIIGANTGYQADSPAETTIAYNGTHVETPNGTQEVNFSYNESQSEVETPFGFGWVHEWIGEGDNQNQEVENFFRSFAITTVKAGLHAAFAVADVVASAVYILQFPLWLVQGVSYLAALLPVGIIGYIQLERIL